MNTGTHLESRMRANSHVRFGGRRRAKPPRVTAAPAARRRTYSVLVGAELGERPSGRHIANGYRSRRWDTRAGEIELLIPKLRQGSYFPSFRAAAQPL
jgi:Transposase, Mutator family